MAGQIQGTIVKREWDFGLGFSRFWYSERPSPMGKTERAGMLGEKNTQDQGAIVSGPRGPICCQGWSRKSPGPRGKAVPGLGSSGQKFSCSRKMQRLEGNWGNPPILRMGVVTRVTAEKLAIRMMVTWLVTFHLELDWGPKVFSAQNEIIQGTLQVSAWR